MGKEGKPAKEGKSGKSKPRAGRRRGGWTKASHVGAPPGVLTEVSGAPPAVLRILAYDAGDFREASPALDELPAALAERDQVVWLDVVGVRDVAAVRAIGQAFSLHPLALEDVTHLGQRAKMEEYEDHLFLVAQMVAAQAGGLEFEQLSIFVGRGFVITFQEREGDCLEPVRHRIRSGVGLVRTYGSDYLAYALLDAVLDHYFPVADALGDQLEVIEDEILAGRGDKATPPLLRTRHDLRGMRRAVSGMRNMLSDLWHGDAVGVIRPGTGAYLRDCHDHAMQLVETVDALREFGGSLFEVHLAVAGQQLNAVMKVLTIISTIFIPLSFIAGLYGMNFDQASPWNMPELRWTYGYVFCLALMVLVAVAQLYFFRRRGWLGDGSSDVGADIS